MTPRTKAPASLDNRAYWRRLKAAVHPDQDGGDHELFLFLTALEEHVRGSVAGVCRGDDPRQSYARAEEAEQPDRIPYDPIFGNADEFSMLTCRALSIGQEVEEPFAEVLALLVDCPAHGHGRAVPRQSRGASYKQLARIAHSLGWSKEQRVRWYRIAESVPLSCAHAGHIIAKAKHGAGRSAA